MLGTPIDESKESLRRKLMEASVVESTRWVERLIPIPIAHYLTLDFTLDIFDTVCRGIEEVVCFIEKHNEELTSKVYELEHVKEDLEDTIKGLRAEVDDLEGRNSALESEIFDIKG